MTTPSKPLLKVLAGETVYPPPIWLMRQAGRYLPEYRAVRAKARDFLELCFTPDLAAEVTLQPIRRYGFDAAILFSDILVVPYALGQTVRFVEGEGPKLAPLRRARDVDGLSCDRLRAAETPLESVYETVRRVRQALPPPTTLIGFAGAPWTVACYMVEGGSSRDFQAVKQWALGDPDGFDALIEKLTEATIDYLLRQVEAGAEVVQLFDSHAGVLPSEAYARWIVAPAAQIVAALRSVFPALPVIGFPRGSGPNYLDYVKATGVSAVSVDSMVAPAWAAEALQPHVAVQGNLDPIHLLNGGATMREAATGILAALGKRPMIFNLGHGVIKETPPDHVAELVAIVRGNGVP